MCSYTRHVYPAWPGNAIPRTAVSLLGQRGAASSPPAASSGKALLCGECSQQVPQAACTIGISVQASSSARPGPSRLQRHQLMASPGRRWLCRVSASCYSCVSYELLCPHPAGLSACCQHAIRPVLADILCCACIYHFLLDFSLGYLCCKELQMFWVLYRCEPLGDREIEGGVVPFTLASLHRQGLVHVCEPQIIWVWILDNQDS